MLKKIPFANSLAAVLALGYVVMYMLNQVAPQAAKFFSNFSLLGNGAKSTFDVSALIGTAIMGWVVGYVWAWLYNRWA